MKNFMFMLFIIVLGASKTYAKTEVIAIDELTLENTEILKLPTSIDKVCRFFAIDEAPIKAFRQPRAYKIPKGMQRHFERVGGILFPNLLEASPDSIDSQTGFVLRKLCVDNIYDNGFASSEGLPLFKNNTCPKQYILPKVTMRAIRALLSSKIIRGIELGCIKFGYLQFRDIEFDFFVLKSSDVHNINIQNSKLGSVDVHNSEVGQFTLQGTEIGNRLLISRSTLEKIWVIASPISDIQIYDFYLKIAGSKQSERQVSHIDHMAIGNSKIGNFRTYRTDFGKLHIDNTQFSTVSLFPQIRNGLRLTNSIIETSLTIVTSSGDTPNWAKGAFFDLSGTYARTFSATRESFTYTDEDLLIPTNFNGFSFSQTARSVQEDIGTSKVIPRHMIYMSASELSDWIEQSGKKLNIDSGRDFIYQVSKYLRQIGDNDKANSLAAIEKSKEWFDRNILIWIVGKISGFGYQNSNLWFLLVFLPIGALVKMKARIRNHSDSMPVFSPNKVLQDMIFSIDRFLSPLIIQKHWDNYPDLTSSEKTYFYVHRIAGSIALLLGAFSLVGEF